jgi:hypothetical protein
MSEFTNTEAPWQEVAGPEATPWSPTPGSDAHPAVGSVSLGVAEIPPQIDIDRIRDDFAQSLNEGVDHTTVPVPGVTTDSGKPATATVPVPWSDSRKKQQAARLQRWMDAQDRLGAGIAADEAAQLQRELTELTAEGQTYVNTLHTIPGAEEDATSYTYESYSHPLDDLDVRRHRAADSWTRRVEAFRQRLAAHEARLELSGYEIARQFYMRNPAAAERAREALFGSEELELPPEVAVPSIEPLELNQTVHRSQKMTDEREKVRRALYERDMIRTNGTPIDTNAYPAFRDRQ